MKPETYTPEDLEALRQMLASPGWAVADRILNSFERYALEDCGMAVDDQRFFQGRLNGIRNVRTTILAIADPKKTQVSRSAQDYS